MFNLFNLAKENLIGKSLCLFKHEIIYNGKPGYIITHEAEINNIDPYLDTIPEKMIVKIIDIEYIFQDYETSDGIRIIFKDKLNFNPYNQLCQDIRNYIEIDYLTDLILE